MSPLAANLSRRALVRQPLAKFPVRRSQAVRQYGSKVQEAGLNTGPKRDPELYVLLGVMAGVFGLAGWYFGRKPTSSVSESNVRIGQSAMPWQLDEKDVDRENANFKYQYHPHGDSSKPLKKAPSALNEVVVPNVTLPQDLHERFNKYGKDL